MIECQCADCIQSRKKEGVLKLVAMNKVAEILTDIANASGKAKAAIIADNCDNLLFFKVVKYALDQNRTYNLTRLPPVDFVFPDLELFSYLDYLASKRGATTAEAEALSSIANQYGTAGVEVVTKIIQKKLRIGAEASTFNSIIPGWVYEVPYQSYSSFSKIDSIDFENDWVVVELKNDGQFAYLMPDGSFLSRNGSSYSLNGAIDSTKEWIAEIGDGLVWMGELLVLGPNGKYLPRQTGNGIINKFILGEGDPENEDKIRYVTWGCILKKNFDRGYCDGTYQEMRGFIEPYSRNNGKILLNKSVRVGSKAEALDFYAEARSRKEEGAIAKVANKLKWRAGSSRSPFGVKLKPVAEGEFEIVDAYPGDEFGKYSDYLGGLVVKSSCGKLITRLGGGFSDEQRKLGVPWWKDKIGCIITGKFTGISTDKTDRETYALEHGRFVETRFTEKTEADTLEHLFEELKKA